MSLRYLIIFMMVICGSLPSQAAAEIYPVPKGKVAVLIGQDNDTIDHYLKEMDHSPAGFMVATSIQDPKGLSSWSLDYGAGRSNADKLLSRHPGKAIQIGLYMVDALTQVYHGDYDDNIAFIAEWMKKVNCPVFLRIGYEFDGAHNHYDPIDYQKAYRYLVDKFRAAGVVNVDYVWHSYANKPDVSDIAPWYPGDDYVDWVGLTYFAQPQNFMTHVVDFARKHGKPLMIAEATPAGKFLTSPLAWKSWFSPFFRFVKTNDIRVISYINSNWDAMPLWKEQHWRDARIEVHGEIKKLWLEKMRDPRYRFYWE